MARSVANEDADRNRVRPASGGGAVRTDIRAAARRLLFASFGLAALLLPPATAAIPVTLQVVTPGGSPGSSASALSRFVAAQTAKAGLADWRFAPAAGDGVGYDFGQSRSRLEK